MGIYDNIHCDTLVRMHAQMKHNHSPEFPWENRKPCQLRMHRGELCKQEKGVYVWLTFVNMHACTQNTMRTFTNSQWYTQSQAHICMTYEHPVQGQRRRELQPQEQQQQVQERSSFFYLCWCWKNEPLGCGGAHLLVFLCLFMFCGRYFTQTIFCQFCVRKISYNSPSAICFGDNFR